MPRSHHVSDGSRTVAQIRRVLAARATWNVVLPGLGHTVAEVKQEMRKEMLADKL